MVKVMPITYYSYRWTIFYRSIRSRTRYVNSKSSALLVDSNKAIDEIFIGNAHATVGGTLKLNEGTNNGTNFHWT